MPLSEGKRKSPFWRALIGCSKLSAPTRRLAESWQQQLSGEFPFRQQFHASQRQTAWLYWLNLFGCTSDLWEQRSLASRARPLRPCSPAASQLPNASRQFQQLAFSPWLAQALALALHTSPLRLTPRSHLLRTRTDLNANRHPHISNPLPFHPHHPFKPALHQHD